MKNMKKGTKLPSPPLPSLFRWNGKRWIIPFESLFFFKFVFLFAFCLFFDFWAMDGVEADGGFFFFFFFRSRFLLQFPSKIPEFSLFSWFVSGFSGFFFWEGIIWERERGVGTDLALQDWIEFFLFFFCFWGLFPRGRGRGEEDGN